MLYLALKYLHVLGAIVIGPSTPSGDTVTSTSGLTA